MSAHSKHRGHPILYVGSKWIYADPGRSVSVDPGRACGVCKKDATSKGHDSCLRNLPGVSSACCGHGKPSEAYIQFTDGTFVRGFTQVTRIN